MVFLETIIDVRMIGNTVRTKLKKRGQVWRGHGFYVEEKGDAAGIRRLGATGHVPDVTTNGTNRQYSSPISKGDQHLGTITITHPSDAK